MDNTIETIEIVTPVSKQPLKLKKMLTARDLRNINAVMLDDVDIQANQEKPDIKIKGSLINKMIDKQIETIVLEFNGSSDDILNRILDLGGTDYNFIVSEVQNVAGEVEEVKKKD